MKNYLKSIKYLALSALSFPLFASAQSPSITSLQSLLQVGMTYISSLTRIVVILGLVFFFWGMALFIHHAGEEDKEEDKKKMLWGIITITVMFAIWGIVKFLQLAFFGSISP